MVGGEYGFLFILVAPVRNCTGTTAIIENIKIHTVILHLSNFEYWDQDWIRIGYNLGASITTAWQDIKYLAFTFHHHHVTRANLPIRR